MAETLAEKEKRWEAKLDESDAKDREISEYFDPRRFIGLTLDIQVIDDEFLGKVKYKRLNMWDLLSLRGVAPEEQAQRTIHMMLEKADSTFTWDVWVALPHDVSSRLLTLLTPEMSFLAQQQTTQKSPSLNSGSAKTETPS